MELELDRRLFEWLLADWTGYDSHPGDVFPSLRGVDCDQLAQEFFTALREARAPTDVLSVRPIGVICTANNQK